MNKEELINLLKSHKENKAKLTIKLKELKNKRIKLKHCEETETNITSSFGINQDIHSKNKIGNKVLDRIEKNDELKRKTEEEIEELEKEVRTLRENVEAVEDRLEGLKYKEREILIAYYIDGRTYEDIGENLHNKLFQQKRNWETIKKIVEKATKKMIEL